MDPSVTTRDHDGILGERILSVVHFEFFEQPEILTLTGPSNVMFGLNPDRQANPYAVRELLSPSDQERWLRYREELRATNADPIGVRFQFNIAGTNKWILTSMRALRTTTGEYLGMTGTCTDVTAYVDLLEEQAETCRGLTIALDSRTVIEQAKGVLAKHFECTPEQAFQGLRSYARSNRRTLQDVCAATVEAAATGLDFKSCECLQEVAIAVGAALKHP